MIDDTETNAPRLNEYQSHHLSSTCQYVDRLLCDIDGIVAMAETDSPFDRYTHDLAPTSKRLLRDYAISIRAHMMRVLQRHQCLPRGSAVPAVRAIRTRLASVDIAIEELKPRYMRGYGSVPQELVPELNGLVEELQSLVGVGRFAPSAVTGPAS